MEVLDEVALVVGSACGDVEGDKFSTKKVIMKSTARSSNIVQSLSLGRK